LGAGFLQKEVPITIDIVIQYCSILLQCVDLAFYYSFPCTCSLGCIVVFVRGKLTECDFVHNLTAGYVVDVVKQCSFTGRDHTILFIGLSACLVDYVVILLCIHFERNSGIQTYRPYTNPVQRSVFLIQKDRTG
jgi:hypothetical protein